MAAEEPIATDGVARAADALWHAATTGVPCAPVREHVTGPGLRLAYRAQMVNVERAERAGRGVIGRKVGLTAAAVRTQLGVDEPDFGTLLDDMCFADGDEIPFGRFLQPRVEAEVAFVLARDLDGAARTVSHVMRAVDFVLPAIEVVDSRVAGWDISIEDTVADNASSGAFVLGLTPRRLSEVDLRTAGMTMTCAGEEVSTGAGVACLGHPLIALTWLARTLVSMGSPLRAGDVVLSGALGPVVPAGPGTVYEARISQLGSVRAVLQREPS